MKTPVAFIALLIYSSFAFGQQKSIAISEKKITDLGATLLCSYNKAASEKGDTIHYILILFRDLQLQSAEEYRSIRFPVSKSSPEVFQFVRDLKAGFAKMDSRKDMAWKRDLYTISVNESHGLLFIEDGQKGGYTGMSQGSVEQLIEWLAKIGFKA
jgi:hypothetical protein